MSAHKTDFELGLERGFLPIVETQVTVTGTIYAGQKGVVVERPEGWPRRAVAVKLDLSGNVVKLFVHNLRTEFDDIEISEYP